MEYSLEHIVSQSDVMQQIAKDLRPFIDSAAPLLFWGETKTGMGFYARTIHDVSSRQGKFLIIPAFELEDDTVKQHFLGEGEQSGWIEEAHQGTIFLRRISEASPKVQKILFQLMGNQSTDGRFQFSRKGRTESLEVNVRFIFSMAHDLNMAIQDGLLAHDLADEIKKRGKLVHLPPLRERREDIAGIARNFFADFNPQYQQAIRDLDDEAQQILTNCNWPGNIDELKRVIEGIFAHYPGISVITAEHLPAHVCTSEDTGNLYSFKLKNDVRFTARILTPFSLKVQAENQSVALPIAEILEIQRVEDAKFAPAKFKHFAFRLKDASQIIGKIKDQKMLVSTSFDPAYEILTQDIYSVILA